MRSLDLLALQCDLGVFRLRVLAYLAFIVAGCTFLK